MTTYDIRPRSFGQIGADVQAIEAVWPELRDAILPLGDAELPWHLGALQRRIREFCDHLPDVFFDLTATKEIHEPTREEAEAARDAELRGDEVEANRIVADIMSRPGRKETGIERARRVFFGLDAARAELLFLTRVNSDGGIPSKIAQAGPIKPSTRELVLATIDRWRNDIETMKGGPSNDSRAGYTIDVTVPGPGEYPIPTGIVHVATDTFAVELPGATYHAPRGAWKIRDVEGNLYRLHRAS